MKKKNGNIESYDGQDAFYTGTDAEYEEFLKNIDSETEEAEPVENTQKINLGETINLQSVIERFKKTAGGIESGAKKLRDTVVTKMDEYKAKKENNAAMKTEKKMEAENDEEETPKVEVKEKIKEVIKETAEKAVDFKDGIVSITELSGKIESVEEKILSVENETSAISAKMDEIADKLKTIEGQERMRMGDNEKNHTDMKRALNEIMTNVADIRQSVNSVSRLNDSVFDLKNAQMNTKKVLTDVTASFVKLKKKCVLGITVLSILSAIIIVLEIMLMLS